MGDGNFYKGEDEEGEEEGGKLFFYWSNVMNQTRFLLYGSRIV